MQDAMRLKEILKVKLSTIITSNSFDFTIKLNIHHRSKLWKVMLSIRLMFKKIHPSTSSKIIHNCQNELKTINGTSSKWTPEVTMNQIKRFIGYMSTRSKGKLLLL